MKIEIIIPTVAGREEYLRWCIESCIRQEENCSILISNNGGAPSVSDLIKSFSSRLIRLIEPPTYLPMALHWEFAFSQSRGDVISIIGDDDALMPDAISRIAKLFAEYPAIACITHKPGQYFWADYLEESYKNKFWLPERNGGHRIVSTKPLLKEVVEFRENYVVLPYLYHGFVKRQALEQIRKVNGGLFKRASPDVYSDFLLSAYLDSFLVVDDCLSLGGQGAKSNGANFFLNTDMSSEFFAGLPSSFIPIKWSAKSVNLQLLEYIISIPPCAEMQKIGHPRWIRFVIRTIIEGITRGGHRDEIHNGLLQMSKEILPYPARMIVQLLTCPFRVKLFGNLAYQLHQLRRRKNALKWRDAKQEFGAQNIFDLTTALAKNMSK